MAPPGIILDHTKLKDLSVECYSLECIMGIWCHAISWKKRGVGVLGRERYHEGTPIMVYIF